MAVSFHQNAFVLDQCASGETSARVTLLTQEYGVIKALFKGGRAPSKQSSLQLFTPVWASLSQRGEWIYINKVEILAPRMDLTGKNFFIGLYLTELVYLAMQPMDGCYALYAAYVQTLVVLSEKNSRIEIESALRRFEWTLLTTIGYHISLTQEANKQDKIVAEQNYRLIPGAGFVCAEQGISGAHILCMYEDLLNNLEVLKSAKWILRQLLEYALDGKVIQTRSLYCKYAKLKLVDDA